MYKKAPERVLFSSETNAGLFRCAGGAVVDAVEQFLCIDVATDGGFFQPFDGFGLVLVDTLTTVVHVAEEGRCVGIAGFGAFGQQFFSLFVVLLDVYKRQARHWAGLSMRMNRIILITLFL